MATSYFEQFLVCYLRESGFEVKNNSKLANSRCRTILCDIIVVMSQLSETTIKTPWRTVRGLK